MSDAHSSTSAAADKPAKPEKPAKPSPDFPLFPHATGKWAKKVKGHLVYFGRWDDPQGALSEYEAWLKAGVTGPHPAATPGGKPEKPRPDFPLFAHECGQWCKKILGKLYYFGVWADPHAALDKYLKERDALHQGKKPREETEGLTVIYAANHFLTTKEALMNEGGLSPRTMQGYKLARGEVVTTFGKARLVEDLDTDDFAKLRNKMSKRYGPHGLGTFIQCARCLFKHAFDAGLIDRPIRFGPGFKRPSKKRICLHKAKQGPKLFTAEEVRKLLDALAGKEVATGRVGDDGKPELVTLAPNPGLRAMVLLGINCGFGNADCGRLPISTLDLKAGAFDYPRPKTGIQRRVVLWPETVEALRLALAARRAPKSAAHAGLVFLTSKGLSWSKDTNDDPISKEMRKLLHALGINGRKGLNFYALRHTFRTVADEARDQPAADYLMGHEAPHMSSHYRERIGDERLKAVVDHVHSWLFPQQ
jgi:integrase